MGTHCAMTFVTETGTVTNVERTMDGYYLMGVFEEWLPRFVEDRTIDQPDHDSIGNGDTQYGSDRECRHEYYLHINVCDKIIGMSFLPDKVFRELAQLQDEGWTVCAAYDIHDLPDAEYYEWEPKTL